jgi:hypothetical protein
MAHGWDVGRSGVVARLRLVRWLPYVRTPGVSPSVSSGASAGGGAARAGGGDARPRRYFKNPS